MLGNCGLVAAAIGTDRAISAAQATPAKNRIFTGQTFYSFQALASPPDPHNARIAGGFKRTGAARCPARPSASYAPIMTGVPMPVVVYSFFAKASGSRMQPCEAG